MFDMRVYFELLFSNHLLKIHFIENIFKKIVNISILQVGLYTDSYYFCCIVWRMVPGKAGHTLRRLKNTHFQSLEGFTGQFFQGAQRRCLRENDPFRQGGHRVNELLGSGNQVRCPTNCAITLHRGFAENVLYAERSEGFDTIHWRRRLI